MGALVILGTVLFYFVMGLVTASLLLKFSPPSHSVNYKDFFIAAVGMWPLAPVLIVVNLLFVGLDKWIDYLTRGRQ